MGGGLGGGAPPRPLPGDRGGGKTRGGRAPRGGGGGGGSHPRVGEKEGARGGGGGVWGSCQPVFAEIGGAEAAVGEGEAVLVFGGTGGAEVQARDEGAFFQVDEVEAGFDAGVVEFVEEALLEGLDGGVVGGWVAAAE